MIRTEIICKSLFKLINNNIELIIINCKANRPLKPSIKFAPFIINKKQISTKMLEKNLFSIQDFKNIRSKFSISMEKKLMKKIKKIIIIINLTLGLILNFTSSK